jgi:hypothetical protein
MTHLDTDVLAEFRAGLITGRRGAKIAGHLAGCERCTALDDELAGVSALLASVPAPPMPDRVAQRLETVLAAEVTKRNNYAERGEVDRPGVSAAPGRPARVRGFRLATWRVLVPAGAAVVLLAGGGYGLSRIVGGQGSPQSFSAAAGSAASSSSSAAAGSATSASRAGPPEAAPVSSGGPVRRAVSPAYAHLRVVTSHTNFVSAKAKLKQQLEDELNTPEGTTEAASTQTIGCVQNVVGNASPIRVVSALFEGRPATIIIAQESKGDMAWVVGLDCSAANPHVLATTTLP